MSQVSPLSSETAQKICLIFDEQHLRRGISGPALFMNGEWCINSFIMYMYITLERTCPIACHIDSGVSYESPVRSIWKNIWRWRTKSLRSCIDKLSPRMHGHSWEVAESVLNSLASTDQGECLHMQQILFESGVCEITWGETKMGCQLALPRESYQCYWILSLIWLAITLHLPLTTLFSIHGSFTSSTGLVASTEAQMTCLTGSDV